MGSDGVEKNPPPVRKLTAPLQEEEVRKLHAGDFVDLSGQLLTARDAAHKRLAAAEEPPVSMQRSIIYHCGPVILPDTAGGWRIIAAGPTTSSREEPYMANIISSLNLRMIIGKGGMGNSTLDACRRCGCVYAHAVGGAAQVLAQLIKNVQGPFWPEEGLSEAIWKLEVNHFPLVITMDSHGKSIHSEVKTYSAEKLTRLKMTQPFSERPDY